MGQQINTKSKLVETNFVSKTNFDIDTNNLTFKSLLKEIDLDKWYYTNKKIPYTHNDYGYRCDDISSIEDNDYILTFGCSYSYGQGLFYEDVYTTKLAKKLNLKNINLSIPGSGLKIQTYNTILFINNFIKKRLPKYVIYQYPHDYRVSFALKNGSSLHLETKTINTDDEYVNSEYIKKYFLENEGMKYLQDLLEPLYLNNIWETLNIPVFHITFGDYIQEYKSLHQKFDIINIESDSTKLDYYELARDLSHNGRKFHDKVYKTLLNKIKNG